MSIICGTSACWMQRKLVQKDHAVIKILVPTSLLSMAEAKEPNLPKILIEKNYSFASEVPHH